MKASATEMREFRTPNLKYETEIGTHVVANLVAASVPLQLKNISVSLAQ